MSIPVRNGGLIKYLGTRQLKLTLWGMTAGRTKSLSYTSTNSPSELPKAASLLSTSEPGTELKDDACQNASGIVGR